MLDSWLQHPVEQVLQKRGVFPGEGETLVPGDGCSQECHSLFHERRPAFQHLVEHHAQTPDLRRERVGLLGQQFGGHVRGTADDGGVEGVRTFLLLAEAEVGH